MSCSRKDNQAGFQRDSYWRARPSQRASEQQDAWQAYLLLAAQVERFRKA